MWVCAGSVFFSKSSTGVSLRHAEPMAHAFRLRWLRSRETRRPRRRQAVRRVRFVSRCHHDGRVVRGSAQGRQTTGSSTCLPAFGAVLGSGSSPWPLWLSLGGCPSSCAAMALALPRALPRGVPKAPRPMPLAFVTCVSCRNDEKCRELAGRTRTLGSATGRPATHKPARDKTSHL